MKLITFIGTGDYKKLVYSFNNKHCQTEYIQKALVDIFKDEINSILLCFTKQSEEKHKEKIIKELEPYNKIISSVIIKPAFNEDEIKENFKILYDNIVENENIIFDITHGFRVIPLTASVIALYIKILKNAKITKVLYGAAEKLTALNNISIKDKVVPIVDASYLINIFDFSIAVSEFLNTGTPQKLSELTQNELKPLLNKNKKAQVFNNYFKLLLEFNNKITTCRIGGKSNKTKNIDSTIEKIFRNKITSNEVTLLDPLIDKINKEYEMDRNDKYIKILEYCVKYNYIQQGYTILNEIIPTIILEKIHEIEKINDEYIRTQVESFLKSLSDKKRKYEFTLSDEIKTKISKLSNIEELGKLLRNIEDYRNDINHASFRDETINGKGKKNIHEYKDIKKALETQINLLKKFMMNK